ncbi:hypothetical protein D3C71_79530 [compost metagenome]
MAKFKDPYLKQIADDLAIQNPAAPVLPLERLSLTNVVSDASAGDPTNSRATLVVADGGDEIPSGSMAVYYRRLDLATLVGSPTHTVSFPGPELQSATLLQMLTKINAGLAAYLEPDLVDDGPYYLTRDMDTFVLTAKPGSESFVGSLSVQARTTLIDISFWAPVQSANLFKETPADTLAANADLDQELINRIFSANAPGVPPPNKSECVLEYSAVGGFREGYPEHLVKITMKPEAMSFIGENTFTYNRRLARSVFPAGTGSTIDITTDEQDMRTVVLNLFASQGLYPPKLPADMGWVNSEGLLYSRQTEVIFDLDDPYYCASTAYDGLRLKIIPITVVPYEAVFDFTVTDQYQPEVYDGVVKNYQGLPTQMEVLSAPAGFTDPTIQIVNNRPGVTLPPGVYKVRLAAPDASLIRNPSYPTLIYGVIFHVGMRITKLYKLVGLDHSSTFRFGWLSEIAADCFVSPHAHRTWSIRYAFADAAVTVVPAGVFDPLTRCMDFSSVFDGNDVLTTVPAKLFADQRAVYSATRMLRDILRETGVVTLPSQLLHNLKGFSYEQVFGEMKELTTVPADVLSGLHDVNYGWAAGINQREEMVYDFTRAFQGCAKLVTIPAGLFDVVRNKTYPVDFNYTFFLCPLLNAIPAGLFDNVKPFSTGLLSVFSAVYEFNYTFADCPSITSVPEGLWATVPLTAPGGTFAGTGLTAIPPALLRNQPNLRYAVSLFARTKITQIPTGLFDGSREQLKEVTDLFKQCNLLTLVPSGVFANMPALTGVSGLFNGATSLTGVLDDLFSNSPNIETVVNLFSASGVQQLQRALFAPFAAKLRYASSMCFNNLALTTVESQLLEGSVLLSDAQSMFQGCSALTTVGGRIFGSSNTAMRLVGNMFRQCTSLASVPADLLQGITTIVDIQRMFSLTGLTALPAGIFADTAPVLENVSNLCEDSAALVTIPTGLFANANAIASAIGTFRGTGVVNPPIGIFSSTHSIPIRMANIFFNSKVQNVPANFFAPKNIIELDGAFRGCPLVSVGSTIVRNEGASTLTCNAMFGDFGGVNKQNFTIGDNVITSTIPLTLSGGMGPGQGILGSNNLIAANIDNLFGANIRINSTCFLGTAAANALTGNGANFITKHQVTSSANRQGLFYNAVNLSDYATLPTWAKNWPS